MYQCILNASLVLKCSKLFNSKLSSGFLQQDSQSSYGSGKNQNVRVQNFLMKKDSVSLEKDFIFQFYIYFSTSFAFISKFHKDNPQLEQWFLLTPKHLNSGTDPLL